MKLNKNIIILAVASATALTPLVSQSTVALATSAHVIKTNSKWSKKHQKANKYYNLSIKKSKTLPDKDKLALLQKTLKHFKSYKTNYAKKYRSNLKKYIKELKKKKVVNNKPTSVAETIDFNHLNDNAWIFLDKLPLNEEVYDQNKTKLVVISKNDKEINYQITVNGVETNKTIHKPAKNSHIIDANAPVNDDDDIEDVGGYVPNGVVVYQQYFLHKKNHALTVKIVNALKERGYQFTGLNVTDEQDNFNMKLQAKESRNGWKGLKHYKWAENL